MASIARSPAAGRALGPSAANRAAAWAEVSPLLRSGSIAPEGRLHLTLVNTRERPAAHNAAVEMKVAEYPAHLARQGQLADGRTVLIRPVRAQDEAAEREYFAGLSSETRRLRFQRFTGVITDALMHFYTHIDYDRHMAFVCESEGRLVGDARYLANRGTRSCELGIVIADDWHHTGVAQLLMQALIRAAQAHGFETMEGLVLSENVDMLGFVKELGFEAQAMHEEPTMVRVVKKL
jgi:acetyltransferase